MYTYILSWFCYSLVKSTDNELLANDFCMIYRMDKVLNSAVRNSYDITLSLLPLRMILISVFLEYWNICFSRKRYISHVNTTKKRTKNGFIRFNSHCLRSLNACSSEYMEPPIGPKKPFYPDIPFYIESVIIELSIIFTHTYNIYMLIQF